MTKLHVFTDESGNTGSNLFDKNQPFFWIGTFISAPEFSEDYKLPSDLHGCETSIEKINEIAGSILNLIQSEECQILVSKLCKRHHARLKIFDHIFDSGYNQAVSGVHYYVRPLRLSLLEAFIKYLSPKTEEQFWEFRSKPDSKKFTSILDRILWNIRNKEKDGRLKELLSEAILFAINNPSEFICRKTINDSPNIALFSIIVQELHYLARKWDISYEKFVHDQTSEFSTALNFAYGLLSKVEFKEENEVMRAKKALNSFNKPKIIFKTRQSCLQLRIVDLILWTITRVSKKGYFEGYDNINNLYDLLLKKAHFSYLTPEQLAFENQFYKEKFSGEEFSAEQLDNARQYLASIEKNRKKALL